MSKSSTETDESQKPLPIPPKGTPPPQNSRHCTSPSSGKRSRKSRDRFPGSGRDWIRLLAIGEREAKDLHERLLNVTEQLRAEKQRADEAERNAQEVLARMKLVNEAKLAALRDVARVEQELKLYKIQLEKAQSEIYKAQDTLRTVDAQRHEAEKDAARARSTARKLHEEKIIYLAREEGRRIGIREGLARGRDLGFQEGFARAQSMQSINEDDYYDGDYDARQSSLSDESEDYGSPRTDTQPLGTEPTVPSTTILASSGGVRPTIIRSSAPSPRHPPVTLPPDNFIPHVDNDSFIRLPPPHEMSRPPPTPSREPTPPLPAIPEREEQPLHIPVPPRTETPQYVRRSSPESNSTTISQFEMVKDPGPSRRSPMSVIAEVRSSHTSPNMQGSQGTPSLRHQSSLAGPSLSNLSTEPHAVHATHDPQSSDSSQRTLNIQRQPSLNGPTITVGHVDIPSLRGSVANLAKLEEQAKYIRPRSSSNSSDSSHTRISRAAQQTSHRGSISSANSVPDITIQPPSRPSSSRKSSPDVSRRMGGLLSPADAHRPLLPSDQPVNPPPDSGVAPTVTPPVPLTSTTEITGVFSDTHLPPGFVPSGFTPAPSANQVLSPLFDLPVLGADPMPGAFYDAAYQGSGEAVIPDPSLLNNRLDASSESSSVSSGFGSDNNSLTTPPGRSKAPRSNYTGTQRNGVKAPLPPSTISGTPRSAGGYLYAPAVDTHHEAGRTPGSRHRTYSTSSGRTHRTNRT